MRETVIRCQTCGDVRVVVAQHAVAFQSTCPNCGSSDRTLDTLRGLTKQKRAAGQTIHLTVQLASRSPKSWSHVLNLAIEQGQPSPWLVDHETIARSGGDREVLVGLARCGYIAWVCSSGIMARLVEKNLTAIPGLGRAQLLERWSRAMDDETGQELEQWLDALPVEEDERWQRLLVTTGTHLPPMERMLVARFLTARDPSLDIVGPLGLDPFLVDEDAAPLKNAEHFRHLLDTLVVPEHESPWALRMGHTTRKLRYMLRQRWYAQSRSEQGYLPEEQTRLDRALLRRGYTSWRTPSQREATQLILDGEQDGIVILPTGHGKTVCFDLASQCLDEGDYTLVISPLLALMASQDQMLGDRSVRFKGGMEEDELLDAFEELEDVDIVLVSPELVSSDRFLSRLFEYRLPRRIVIDEAHCVLEWGNGFRPEYLNMGSVREKLEDRLGAHIPLVAMTATLTAHGCRELTGVLGLREPRIIRESADRPELYFQAIRLEGASERVDFLESFLGSRLHTCGIIRVAMAQGQHPLSTEALSQHLRQKGLAVEAFHAGLSESRRRELVEQLNSRELQALVVTSSFGMGMDLDWLEWVVHAQPPTSLADYLQGAGRAGRGMLPVFEQALCVVIGDESDRRDLSQQLYYHLPREETLRATLKGWLSSPHDEPEPGVYVDHDNQIITIDTRRQIAQGGAMRYAMRKGALEPLATASHELLRFRVRNSPEVWSNFYRERERDRETIDREWLRVMNLVTGRGCRRATVLSVFDDVPEPPYPGCCDVCDGPVVKDLNRCV